MLVLSRKQREEIRIGDDITITILRVKGQSVSVGVDAPRHVKILRAEVPALDRHEGLSRQPLDAAAPSPTPSQGEQTQSAGPARREPPAPARESRLSLAGSPRATGCSPLATLAARCRQQNRLA